MRFPLSLAIYTTPVKLPKISGGVTSCSRNTRDAAKVISRLCRLTKVEHAKAVEYHQSRSKRLSAVWKLVVEKACHDAFGRPWNFFDYKICAVARNEFSEKHKRVLRHCTYKATMHDNAAAAHERLARRSK